MMKPCESGAWETQKAYLGSWKCVKHDGAYNLLRGPQNCAESWFRDDADRMTARTTSAKPCRNAEPGANQLLSPPSTCEDIIEVSRPTRTSWMNLVLQRLSSYVIHQAHVPGAFAILKCSHLTALHESVCRHIRDWISSTCDEIAIVFGILLMAAPLVQLISLPC
jgi:hypothetical protein